jgi:protein-L-isoaspartate(D-aspartate) O-methyltransferase
MIVVRKNKPKMNHFQLLRLLMIQNQLRPIGIVNEKLLEAFQKTPRELYVFKNFEHLAYHDQLIPLSKSRFLLPASTIAKLINFIDFNFVQKAVVVGCGLGYTVQLLKFLRVDVMGIDRPFFINEAIKRNPKLTTSLKSGSLFLDDQNLETFDLIFIEGGIETIPISLINKININGYLCALIFKEKNMPFQASVFIKEADNTLKPIYVFDSIGKLFLEFSNSKTFEF